MEYIEDLYEMCETISQEIKKANDKIRKSGGMITSSDIDVIDKLTHSLKSIKAAIGMMESEGSYGGSYRGSYDGGMSGNGSYARGRRNAKRDSMGRYSSERGYSRAEEMEGLIEELRSMMDRWPDDTRNAADNLLSKLER